MDNLRIKSMIIEELVSMGTDFVFEIGKETKMIDILDSISILELIMEIEKKLDISIPDSSIEEIYQLTIDQVSSHILVIYEQSNTN